MTTVYPWVPGHEIVGRVKAVGSAAAKFKKGDLVGVGCLVDSDGTCPSCKADLEQFCPNQVWTYGRQDKHLGGTTLGGYSDTIVVDEKFVLRVPENLDLAAVAPLLCAGITTYSPLRHWGVGPGKKGGHHRPRRSGAHTSDEEVIAIQQVNEAYERLLKADVKYRFSINMASLKAE